MSTTAFTNGRPGAAATSWAPQSEPSATSRTQLYASSSSSMSFVGNTPSAVLFFIALAVGAFIAALFVFFTVRYFVRLKFGVHIYSISQRNFFTGATYVPPADYHTDDELQAQLNYIRDNHFLRNEALDRRLLRRRRRRRNRYSKMKKLTAEEVQTLFPKKSYYDWLNGGKEHDHRIRDGAIREEELVEEPKPVAAVPSASRSATNSADDVEQKELCTPVPSHTDEASLHFTSGSCAICLELIADEDIVRGLVCGHVFHADCLDPWLTRRRACCPMCKRDYFFKEPGESSAADRANDRDNSSETSPAADAPHTNDTPEHGDDNANNGDDTNNADDDDESIDFDAFRNDPTLRAFLQELIPTEERVRMILNDESLRHLNLEEHARELTKKRCSNALKVVFWSIMGISRQDLFNYGVLTLHHDYRLNEARQRAAAQTTTRLANDADDTNEPTHDSRHTGAHSGAQTSPQAAQAAPRASSQVSLHTLLASVISSNINGHSRSETDISDMMTNETRRESADNRV